MRFGLLLCMLMLSGCTLMKQQNIVSMGDTIGSRNIDTGLQSVWTGSSDVVTGFTGDVMGYQLDRSDNVLSQDILDKQWTQGGSSLYTNDNDRIGQYSVDRAYHLVSTIGIHAVDMIVGYSGGYLYMDGYDYIVRFAVDGNSFVSQYYTQMWIENDRGSLSKVIRSTNTGSTLDSRDICQPGKDYQSINMGANPMRCFAEDTNYVYGRKEHQPGERGYELVRVKK